MSPSIDSRENREFASEIKFLVSPGLAAQISGWARGRLQADRHGAGNSGDAYQITSLYLDTERMDVYQRNGSFGRSKYRIRHYGTSEGIFLERKLKTRGLLTKRRSFVRLDELERLAEPEPERGWPGCWFHRRILARRLQPVCQITYRRTARVAMTPYGPIRLTLDEHLRALPVRRMGFTGDEAGAPLLENAVILELKFRCAAPTIFKLLVEEFALNPRRISKYRLAVNALDLAPQTAAPCDESEYRRLSESVCAGLENPRAGGLRLGPAESATLKGGMSNGDALACADRLQATSDHA